MADGIKLVGPDSVLVLLLLRTVQQIQSHCVAYDEESQSSPLGIQWYPSQETHGLCLVVLL